MKKQGCLLGITVLNLLLPLWSGCQLAPTRVIETNDRAVQQLVNKSKSKIQITENTQIIDVRSNFDFSVIHLPKSVNLNWRDFAQLQPPAPGRLIQDTSTIVRRLALKGLHPSKPTVVLGQALEGEGEEGRIAWMLFYLGFEDVQTGNIDLFEGQMTNVENPPLPNVPRWVPDLREGVNISRDEFLGALASRTKGQKVHVIDARTKAEYFNKKGFGEAYSTPDLQAINIEWKEFFTPDGRVNQSMRDQLVGVGVQPGDVVIAISNQGLRSGAVTYALLSLGFTRATNYTGGYTEL